MDRTVLKEHSDELINRAEEVMEVKNDHYAYEDNAFYNFEVQGVICETTPLETMWSCMAKHVAGARKLLNVLGNPDITLDQYARVRYQLTNDKFVDIINYLKLMNAYLQQSKRTDIDKHLEARYNPEAKEGMIEEIDPFTVISGEDGNWLKDLLPKTHENSTKKEVTENAA